MDERDHVVLLLRLHLQLFFPAGGYDLSVAAAVLHQSQFTRSRCMHAPQPPLVDHLIVKFGSDEMLLVLPQLGLRNLLARLERDEAVGHGILHECGDGMDAARWRIQHGGAANRDNPRQPARQRIVSRSQGRVAGRRGRRSGKCRCFALRERQQQLFAVKLVRRSTRKQSPHLDLPFKSS